MNLNFVAYHKQKYFEALPPSPLHQQICNDLEKRKRQESETSSFYDLFRVKADLLEDIDWFLPRAHQHPKRPHHYLFVGLFKFKKCKKEELFVEISSKLYLAIFTILIILRQF